MSENQPLPESTAAKPRNRRKTMRGKVVSDAMDRTIVVEVEWTTTHPRYRKTIRVRRKFFAHDQENEARVGDVVEIMATRPLSKLKRWRLAKIVQAAPRRT